MIKVLTNKEVKANKEVKVGLIDRMIEAIESGVYDREFEEWCDKNL